MINNRQGASVFVLSFDANNFLKEGVFLPRKVYQIFTRSQSEFVTKDESGRYRVFSTADERFRDATSQEVEAQSSVHCKDCSKRLD